MAAAMSRRRRTCALGALSGTCATPAVEQAIITPRTMRLSFTPLIMRPSDRNWAFTVHRSPLTAYRSPSQDHRPPHDARLNGERRLEHRDRFTERLATERRGEAQLCKGAVP